MPPSSPGIYRPTGPGVRDSGAEDCGVSPRALVSFANGERYDFRSMVKFLTSAPCRANSAPIRVAALSSGIDFNASYPFRLNMFLPSQNADGFNSSIRRPGTLTNFERLQEVDSSLAASIPPLLREYPLTSKEGLNILGQLALLSPQAAKTAMASMIEQELVAGDGLMSRVTDKEKPQLAKEVARSVLRLGADTSVMIAELSDSIEEKALLAQADSLGKMLPTLGLAASVEGSLVPTFNLSAAALNRGVQKGKQTFSEEARMSLFRSIFLGIKATLASQGSLDPGAADLNEALTALDRGTPLTVELTQRIWRDAVRVLADSNTQPALAAAVALSLTPEMVFLRPDDLRRLMAAARNYPRLAGSVEANFILEWAKQWSDMQEGRVKPAVFNRLKRQYFDPLVRSILALDPYLIDPFWLREVLRYGLVKDEDIERRFPRFVLAMLERREQATKQTLQSAGLEPEVSALAENFAVLWTLSNVHLPALLKWVKKYDDNN